MFCEGFARFRVELYFTGRVKWMQVYCVVREEGFLRLEDVKGKSVGMGLSGGLREVRGSIGRFISFQTFLYSSL